MKLRIAKKIGKTWPMRHKLKTRRLAMRRVWKWDVRTHGEPGNWDGFMAMIYGFPSFGGDAIDEDPN